MDHFIETVVATADAVRAELKQRRRQINISFDEWNVWYIDRFQTSTRSPPSRSGRSPRGCSRTYTVADAVVVGNLLISLLKHADRVTAACLAQLVNVIAPIMTEPGGAAWRQTTFFPFAITSRLAPGQALEVKLDAPTYETARYGEVPLVDAVATHDAATGGGRLPRQPHADPAITVTVDLAGSAGSPSLSRRPWPTTTSTP